MSSSEQGRAESLLAAGKPAEALTALQDAVRKAPADAKLRVFLFQLLAILGQWERAKTQLDVVAEMDSAAGVMRQMYAEALQCEVLRATVFSGAKAPMVFGYPDQWLAMLIEALLMEAKGDVDAASKLRARALDLAPASGGTINGERFEWIADADSRIGPVLEAVINNRYYWLPFKNLIGVDIEAPTDLRDQVWLPAKLTFVNGGEALALLPVRYAGTENSSDELARLSRRTSFDERFPGVFCGIGQRVFVTDTSEYSLLDIRSIQFDEPAAAADGDTPDQAEPAPAA